MCAAVLVIHGMNTDDRVLHVELIHSCPENLQLSILLGCDATSLANWFLTFQDLCVV
jgi:hypothetical protein